MEAFAKIDAYTDIHFESKASRSNYWTTTEPTARNSVSNTDIMIEINEFHKSLDNNHEAGIKINHLNTQIVFYIDHIAHRNQSMIYFKGSTESGKMVHFVKHSSELKIELLTLKRRLPDTPKIPFGYDSWDAYNKVKLVNRECDLD